MKFYIRPANIFPILKRPEWLMSAIANNKLKVLLIRVLVNVKKSISFSSMSKGLSVIALENKMMKNRITGLLRQGTVIVQLWLTY